MNKATARAWAIAQGTKSEPLTKSEYTTTEAAALLGLSPEQVRRRCATGALPCHYIGRDRRIKATDIDRFLGKLLPVAPAPTEQPEWARRMERKVDTLLAIEQGRIEAIQRLTTGVSGAA